MTALQAWLIRAALLGVLLSVAAWVLERVARDANRGTRLIWFASMVGTVALPVLAVLVPIARPRVGAAALGSAAELILDRAGDMRGMLPFTMTEALSEVFAPTGGRHGPSMSAPRLAETPGRDPVVVLWVLATAFFLARYAWGWQRLHRAAPDRARTTVHGCVVWLTRTLGPGVVGVFHPRLLIPAWVLNVSHDRQRMILRHEQEHARARDHWLLAIAPLLVALFPWSPALWWQFRRLQFAIEVDCDARVLRAGVPARAYGLMLVEAASHGNLPAPTIVALSGPRSLLERRIRAMMQNGKRSVPSATVRVLLSVASMVAGVLVMTPAPGKLAAQNPVPVTPRVIVVEPSQVPAVSIAPERVAMTAEPATRTLVPVAAAERPSASAGVQHPQAVVVDSPIRSAQEPDPIFVIDGVVVGPRTRIDALVERLAIASVEVLKPGAAVLRFGDVARGGAVLITTRPPDARVEPVDTVSNFSARSGTSKPLIIVNGVILGDRNALTEIDPQDIESIEVIKGAAAARLYGERGNDGVISIRLKRH